MVEYSIDNLAEWVYGLNRWPYFDLCHFILICVAIRDDNPTNRDVKSHPFSTWLACVLSGMAGSLIIQAMCGLPIGAPLANNLGVVMVTVVWYLIFYSPSDVAYRVVKSSPVFLSICLAKELHRGMLLQGGISKGLTAFPNGYLTAIFAGVVAGAGSGIFRTCDRLIRGIWLPEKHELISPTLWTKVSVLSSILLVSHRLQPNLLPSIISHEILYLSLIIFFIFTRLSTSLFNFNLISPLERIFCRILFGSRETQAVAAPGKTGKESLSTSPSEQENKKEK